MRPDIDNDSLPVSEESLSKPAHPVDDLNKYPWPPVSFDQPRTNYPSADAAAGEQADTLWYALQVRSRFEKIVALHLQNKGYEEYVPLYRSRRKWSDRIKEVDLPLFPGYIFCKFDIHRRLPILVIPGVIAVVGVGKNPVAVVEEEIAAIQNVVKSGLSYEPSGYITTGQMVRVERGPLRGLVGIVSATKKDFRLVISVNLLQRSVSVEIDSNSVMPLPITGPPLAKQPAVVAR